MSEEEQDDSLQLFYAKPGTETGEEYSSSSLLGFRNSVDQHFNAKKRSVKSTRNPAFNRSNKILESKLRALGRERGASSKRQFLNLQI